MTVSAVLAQAPTARVPFDLAATETDAGWRQTLHWPVDPLESRAAALDLADRMVAFVAALDDADERDTATLALPVVLNNAATLGLAALAIDRAAQDGIAVEGGPPEVATLAGAPHRGGAFTPSSAFPRQRPRWPLLRRVARTASWTPASRLPGALLRPDAIAVSHNALLRRYARVARASVGYRYAELMLDAAEVPLCIASDDDATDLAARLVAEAVPALVLSQPVRVRLAARLRDQVASAFAEAKATLSALASWHRLPSEIWLSTAGRMPVRSLAIAARRRGGRVTSFDHGGGLFMQRAGASAVIRELSVSDRLVVATEAACSLGRRTLSTGGLSVLREVLPAGGDPTFSSVPSPPKRPAQPRRVMYLPTPLLGFRQIVPPLLPDPVALDWQLRLTAMLSDLSVELLVKPHPEGATGGRHHPVSSIAPVTTERYGRVIGWPDLFVFEYPHSTAFWEALCTRTPVLWVDLGTSDLADRVNAIVARRCHIIRARYDERNLPQIDRAEFEDAVHGAASDADPTEIRALLAGDLP